MFCICTCHLFLHVFCLCAFFSVSVCVLCFLLWAASYDGLMPSLAACHWYVYIMCMYLVNKLSLSLCVAVTKKLISDRKSTRVKALRCDVSGQSHSNYTCHARQRPQLEEAILPLLQPQATAFSHNTHISSSYLNVARTTVLHLFCRMTNH